MTLSSAFTLSLSPIFLVTLSQAETITGLVQTSPQEWDENFRDVTTVPTKATIPIVGYNVTAPFTNYLDPFPEPLSGWHWRAALAEPDDVIKWGMSLRPAPVLLDVVTASDIPEGDNGKKFGEPQVGDLFLPVHPSWTLCIEMFGIANKEWSRDKVLPDDGSCKGVFSDECVLGLESLGRSSKTPCVLTDIPQSCLGDEEVAEPPWGEKWGKYLFTPFEQRANEWNFIENAAESMSGISTGDQYNVAKNFITPVLMSWHRNNSTDVESRLHCVGLQTDNSNGVRSVSTQARHSLALVMALFGAVVLL